jgi:hypothetical protein
MKVELRLGFVASVVAASAGCGALNGWSEGAIESPFQQGEGEGEGEAVVYEQHTTDASGVPFKVAVPDGFGDSRYAVIFVAAADPCLREALTSSLYAGNMAIVHVPAANLTAEGLNEVFGSLESDFAFDDSKTFAVVAGATSRLIEDTRVGDETSPGLMLLSPVGLPPLLDPNDRSDATTIFAHTSDVSVDAMARTNSWPVIRVDGTDDGCAMLTNTNAGSGQIAGEQLRDMLLERE